MVADREQVLRAAAALLVRRPNSAMAEVAQSAGISRATLHRLVPSRDALVVELAKLALSEGEAALEAAKPEDGDAADAVRRVVRELMPIADLYAFLTGEHQLITKPELDAGYDLLDNRLTALIRRGQESGQFRVDLTAEWMVEALVALLTGAGFAVLDGKLAPRDAPRAVAELLISGMLRGGAQ
ncbi:MULTISPECIES: TetR/AcrR family transcriptional regulator [unclassified Crossiella]|uniref:TetR/AcrR family transcriptional regulator n=1 Tax=unclassified Crossiella TaxID=2620835 RepID=UPI001FFF8752|nr:MULTISPECIES: TetR family transcriptional regulator [unclassified Crossiella]MCK2237514.1 TetR/AcrR family transcriptional regulator [Crossiella sp. S99.2]MCK2254800.1 TetR/AcrR family transcriptional regulator [Crossiella sp. S99.1]